MRMRVLIWRNVAWDDLTGSVLDCNEVWKARCKEIGYIYDKAVYKKTPRVGAQARGLKVLRTRWKDINKRRGETDLPEQGRGH